PASWPEALEAAAAGLSAARGRTGVLTGGRLTVEDAYAYSKFARIALAYADATSDAGLHLMAAVSVVLAVLLTVLTLTDRALSART
ncbi:hypothetical protein PUR25_01070, partial [Streptomyces sp. JV181]|uniref:hypothetical protein n=1 Tax=Streptomyces sp. JV181 TaxID=858635 RepID=UPI002E7729B0